MNPEVEQLRQYTRARQTVIDVIRAGKNALHELGFLDKEEQFQALVVKLAEDRFNLAVVGQFKRGKSSLMNAIIGRDLLPTGLLPLTSAITTLCYGPEEKVVLQRKGWIFEQEIELDELAEYVTERGNPGNEKGLIEARVELPIPFFRRGLFFIDTPGIGSANQTSTATTYDFLPEADAVILVTSVEAPMSAVEERFLQDIRKYVRKLFVVVNKIDLLSAQERPGMIDYIHSTIAKSVGMESIRLFPVSSRLGLQAKQQRRPDQLVESGLEAFETELSRFLAKDKSRLFLISILDRAVDILSGDREEAVQMGRNGHELDQTDELQEIRSRLRTLHQEFISDEPLPDLVEKIQLAPVVVLEPRGCSPKLSLNKRPGRVPTKSRSSAPSAAAQFAWLRAAPPSIFLPDGSTRWQPIQKHGVNFHRRKGFATSIPGSSNKSLLRWESAKVIRRLSSRSAMRCNNWTVGSQWRPRRLFRHCYRIWIPALPARC